MSVEVVKIDGLGECLAALNALPDRLTTLAVRPALTYACELLADRARQEVPAAPPTKANADRYGAVMGALRASIKVLPTTVNGTWVNCTVSAGSKVAYYARWVEFGTAPHDIKGAMRKAVAFDGWVRDVIHHPGARKNPFMRRAADGGYADALARFSESLNRVLEAYQPS